MIGLAIGLSILSMKILSIQSLQKKFYVAMHRVLLCGNCGHVYAKIIFRNKSCKMYWHIHAVLFSTTST